MKNKWTSITLAVVVATFLSIVSIVGADSFYGPTNNFYGSAEFNKGTGDYDYTVWAQSGTNKAIFLDSGSERLHFNPTGGVDIEQDVDIVGTTPKLTIGDAGEEDAQITFDGNAQDYHIGLDDTDDSLKIGLGTALGTTDHIVSSPIGAVTKPLQPSFSASLTASETGVTGDDTAWVSTQGTNNWTEVWDTNADFDADGTFTAPVTGKYALHFSIYMDDIAGTHTTFNSTFLTSNRNYTSLSLDPVIAVGAFLMLDCGTIIADMDAGDTWTQNARIQGTGKDVDVLLTNTRMMAWLVH